MSDCFLKLHYTTASLINQSSVFEEIERKENSSKLDLNLKIECLKPHRDQCETSLKLENSLNLVDTHKKLFYIIELRY